MHTPLPRSSSRASWRRLSIFALVRGLDADKPARLTSVMKPKRSAKKAQAAKLGPVPAGVPPPAVVTPAPDFTPPSATAMRPEDRRRARRHMINRTAKIQFGSGSTPRTCTIADISAGGVRIQAEGFEIPDAFVLFVNADGVTRECVYRVVWRLPSEVGAAFVRFVKRSNAAPPR
jgi:hypothetical protein